MSNNTEQTMVVIVAIAQNAANVQAKRVDTLGGENTFHAGLSATGNDPATHYWCNWWMTAEDKSSFVNFMNALVQGGRAWIYDRSVTTPQQVLTEHSLIPLRAFP